MAKVVGCPTLSPTGAAVVVAFRGRPAAIVFILTDDGEGQCS